jgi:phospholipid transport system substrate-binding protein
MKSNMIARNVFGPLLAIVWLLAAVPGWAATAREMPDAIVRDITERLVDEIESARSYYDTQPEQFYQQVDQIISPVIDYRSFSRAIMGRYGTVAYYRGLGSDREREVLKGQVLRFSDAVQERMVRTLSKGLMTFSGERIEVLAPDAEEQQRIKNKQSVSVTQLIYREQDQPLEVQFKLKPDKSGDWRMINVVLDNINLGKQYRDEFASKLRDYNGDIDKVIDYWRNVDVDPQAELEAAAARK